MKPKCTPCEEAKKRRMKNETIQRESKSTRSLGGEENFYSGARSGGDQSGDEIKKGCTFALVALICIPLLTCFALLALVMMLAQIIPELTNYVLR